MREESHTTNCIVAYQAFFLKSQIINLSLMNCSNSLIFTSFFVPPNRMNGHSCWVIPHRFSNLDKMLHGIFHPEGGQFSFDLYR